MADTFNTTFQVLVQGLQQAQQYAQALTTIANAQNAVVMSAQKLNANMPKITTGMTRFDAAGNKITNTVSTINGRLVEMVTHVDSTSKSLAQAQTSTNDFLKSWNLVARVVAGSLISRSVGLIVRGIQDGIVAATEFNLRIGEIETISLHNARSAQEWQQSIRALSDEYGQGLLDTAEGLYQTLSNQIAVGVEATNFLAEAQRFAVISVTDTANAVELLSGALNAYGQSADQADEASAILFKMIEVGRVRAEEVANTMGRVNAVAAELNIPFEEVAAAIATLTRQGVSAAEAMTYVRNIIQKLIRPSDYMKDIFKEWGVTSGAAAVRTKGFVGVLRDLSAEADKASDPMDEIGQQWQRIRAVIGASALNGAFGAFEEDLEKITNGAADAEAAFQKMLNNPGFQLRRELEQIKNIFTVDIGNQLVETLASVNANLFDFSNALMTAIETGSKLVVFGTGAMLLLKYGSAVTYVVQTTGTLVALAPTLQGAMYGTSLAFNATTAAAGRLWAALAANPVVWVTAIAYASYEATSYILEMNNEIGAMSEEVLSTSREAFREVTREAVNMATEVGKQTQDMLDRQTREFDQLLSYMRSYGNEIKDLASAQRSIDELRYNYAVKNKNAIDALALAQQRFNELQRQGQEYIKLEDWENAIKVAQQLERISEDMKDMKGVPVNQRSVGAFGKPGNVYDSRGSFNAAAVAKQYRAMVEKFMADLDAAAKEKGDFTGLSEKAFDKQFENMDKYRKNFEGLTEKIKEQTDKVAEYKKQAAEYLAQLDATFTSITSKTGFLDENTLAPQFNGPQVTKQDMENLREYMALQKAISEQLAAAKMVPLTGAQSDKLAQDVLRFQQLEEALRVAKISVSVLQGWPEDMKVQVQAMASAAQFFATQNNAAESGTTSLKNLQALMPDVTTKVDEMYNAIIKAQGGWTGFGATGAEVLNTMQTMLESLKLDMINFNNQVGLGFQGNNQGGLIKRYAAGGSVGTDTVAAMLAPGEFVTSAAASRKFLPLLTAMNSGSTRMVAGGSVTNNVGDINVTVQGGNTSEATVRQIGNVLRRELKRGNIRLN